MKIEFVPNHDRTKTGLLQIDDARICFRNFRGEESLYNAKGNRSFSIIIPDEETAEELQNDVNEYGAGWNVKLKPAREAGDMPFIHMPVKVKYTDRSQPRIYLISGKNRVELNEDTVAMLDDIDIRRVDLDIRPYDGEGRFGAHRTAYLQTMYVEQNIDRFAARFAEEEYPEE